MRWLGGLVVLSILGCGGLGEGVPSGDSNTSVEGTWVDRDGAAYTFDAEGRCLRGVDDDGEVFTVTETGPVGGVVHWVYEVPSTGYVVTHTVQSLDGDAMTAVWSNSAGASGDEHFTRER